MYRKSGVVLIAVGLLFILVGAGRRAKQEVDFNLVWEKEFDKKIEEVAFGESEDGKLYPKIVVFEDEVRFYDKESKLIISIPCEKSSEVVLSKKANYLGIRTIEEYATKEVAGILSFTVYTDEGKEVWNISEKTTFDASLPSFYISSKNGMVVEVYKGRPALAFRNTKGRISKQFYVFKDDEYDITRGVRGSFSGDGEYFVCISNEQVPVPFGYESITPRSGNPCVNLFDKNGSEIWRYPVKQYMGDYVFISSKGNYLIATGTTGHLKKGLVTGGAYLLNWAGKLLRSYELGTPSDIWDPYVAISPTEQYAVLANLHKVLFLKTSTGKILWEHNLKNNKIIRGICVSKNNIVALMLNVESEDHLSAIVFFDKDGAVIGEKHFLENIFPFDYFKRAKANISSNGKEVGVISTQAISLYQTVD